MADHARKQIRDAVVTALTGLTTTGSRVYASRVYPMGSANLPGLCIYTVEEDIEEATGPRPRTLSRILDVAIEIYAKDNAALDDTIDKICAEVETALGNTKPASVKDLVLSSANTRYDGEGDQPHGVARMVFDAYYQTKEDAPNTIV